jgi:tetratricopeptide (TPR) repeat protein
MSYPTPRAVVLVLLAHTYALAVAAGQCGPTPYDCALYYVQHQEYKTAINTLREVLKEEPRNLKALNLLGIALTQTGQSQDANGCFQEALRLDPGFSPALKNLAINEFTLKQFDASKAHFEELLKHTPGDEVAHLSLAEIDYGRGQCSAALAHYEISRKRVVSSPDLIIHYSRCVLQEGGKQQALTMLALLPQGDAQEQFQAGLMLAGAGVFAAAAQHFELARHDYPDPYQAAFNAALAYVKAGESKEAIRVADEVFAQGIRRAELYNLVSQAYVKQGKVKEAYDALRTATEIDPHDESNYLDFGLLCLDYSNYDLGVEITDIGLSFLPDSDRLYLQRGLMKAMKRQLGEAAQDFERSSKLAPDKTLPYVARAIILIQSGHSQEAVNLLRQRAQRSPRDFLIHYVLGEALLWSGPEVGSAIEQEALQAFQTSIQLNPDFSHARAQLGKMLLKRGEVEPAIAQLEKARELDPSDPTPVYQLALAYRKKGDKLKAQEFEARVGQLHAQKMEDEVRATLKRIAKVGSP